jgi:hypothetical protein
MAMLAFCALLRGTAARILQREALMSINSAVDIMHIMHDDIARNDPAPSRDKVRMLLEPAALPLLSFVSYLCN